MDIPPDVFAEAARRLGFRPDGIADLSSLGLTDEQRAARGSFIGGSDATIIAKAEPDGLNLLAREKWGEAHRSPAELQQLAGHWMEPFILAAFEQQYDVRITRRGERLHSRRRPWMAATLDGWCEYQGGRWVVQVKNYNAFYREEDALEGVRAQVLHESYCADADGTIVVIYQGGPKLKASVFEQDAVALAELIEQEEAFWAAVQEKRLPMPIPAASGRATLKSTPALRSGERDMTGDNAFADAAARWLGNKAAHTAHEAAAKDLKALMPAEVSRAFGYGIEVKASKSNAKTVAALKVEDPAPAAAPSPSPEA